MPISWNNASIRQRARQAIMRGVVKGTEAVRNEAVRLVLDTPKTGRVYRRRSVTHRASAPGEPFASDTGHALASLTTEYDYQNLRGTVTARDPKFLYLEYGTQKMAARPVLRPALANTQGVLAQAVRDELAKEFR